MINLREWALPIYTILMEIAAGTLFLLWVARAFLGKKVGQQEFDRAIQNPLWIILLTVFTSLFGAHFHLSRPYHSFLALLNIKTSWLSREILFSLLFFFLVILLVWLQMDKPHAYHLKSHIGWLAIFFGSATVYAMASIYKLPTQPVWEAVSTVAAFQLSTLLLGLMVLPALLIMDLRYSEIRDSINVKTQTELSMILVSCFTIGAFFVSVAITILEFNQLQSIAQSSQEAIQATYLLLNQYYSILLGLRFILMLGGVVLLASFVFIQHKSNLPISWLLLPSYVACLLVMIAEILSRFLFYALHVRIGL